MTKLLPALLMVAACGGDDAQPGPPQFVGAIRTPACDAASQIVFGIDDRDATAEDCEAGICPVLIGDLVSYVCDGVFRDNFGVSWQLNCQNDAGDLIGIDLTRDKLSGVVYGRLARGCEYSYNVSSVEDE